MRIAKPLLLNHIVSPYGIAALSTVVFLSAWLFPPQLYSSLLSEPDLVFLDPETLLFFFACVTGFVAGLLLIAFLFPSAPLRESKPRISSLRGLALLFPLILTTGMTVVLIGQMLDRSPNILILLLSQQGDALKVQQAEQIVTGPLGWASFMQIGVLWWTYWVLSNSKQQRLGRLGKHRLFSWLLFIVGLVTQTVLCVLKVSRADMMPVFTGLAVLYVLGKIHRRELSTTGVLRYIFLFSLAVVSVFYLFGVLRGTNDVSEGLATFMGYTLASYNRLTAVLHGTMRYPYGGHGVYLSNFLAYNDSLNAIIPLRAVLGWPAYLELWNSEFQAPQSAGLRYELIWSGVFGYLFSDYGWATPLILGGYGVLYGLVWKLIKAGSNVGITLYPWLAFTALCWFSSNMVFDVRFPFLLVTGLMLSGYEKLMFINVPEAFMRNAGEQPRSI